MGRPAKELLGQSKYDPIVAELVDRLGADEAAALWVRAEQRLESLLERAKHLPDAERLHVEGFIYPTCALYLELAEAFGREESYDLLRRFSADLALKNREPFAILAQTAVGRRALVKGFGIVQPRAFGEAAGFSAKRGEHSSTHVHFDITSCPYQRHTAELGVGELCDLFCTNDDIIYGNLPGLRFHRKGTLGRGDAVCDFDISLA